MQTVMQMVWKDIRELWSYRSLLRMLVVRDVKARYKNSALGVFWSFLQPLGMMTVMTVVAGVVGAVQLPNAHLFVLSGLISWNFFSAALVSGAGSVVNNGALVKKVYFPRLVLPVSAVASALLNYLFSLPVFLFVALVSGHSFSTAWLMLPVIIAIQTVLSVGLGLLFATLNVFYRDTQFLLELGLLSLMFLTPIWYDIAAFASSNSAVWLRRLNPMASIVNMYQDVMYRGVPTSAEFVLRTAATALVVLALGYFTFRRYSARFGEEV